MMGTPDNRSPHPQSMGNPPEPVPHVLWDDGPIARALPTAQEKAGDDGDLLELHARCTAVFRRLRAVEEWAHIPALADLSTLQEKLVELLRRPDLWPPCPDGEIFRYLVLQAWCGGQCPPPEPAVLALYFRTNALWTKLFPGLASGDWYEETCRAFSEDANPDATYDWLVAHATFRSPGDVTGFPTGFDSLDRLLGGYRGLALLAGPTGSGKTSLLVNGLINALTADPGLAALVVTTETSKLNWLRKMLSCASGVPFTQAYLPHPDSDITRRLTQADERLLTALSRVRLMTRLFEADSHDEEGPRYMYTRQLLTRATNRLLQRHPNVRRVLIMLDSLDYTPFYVPTGKGRERVVRSGPHDLEADVTKLRELREVV